MAYVNNMIHCVWGTKRRFPFFSASNRTQIIEHIRSYAVNNGIFLDFINVHKDHIHCILSLGPTQNLSTVIKGIKGESSKWISTNIPSCNEFSWASEYYAISIGPGILDIVRGYIQDQDSHHLRKSWEDEQKEFIRTIDKYSQKFRWDKIHD